MERQRVRTLRQFDHNRIIDPIRSVILREFGPQASGLNAHQRIQMGIEISRASEDLSCDLIFLDGNAGVFDGLFGQITEKFAERFGAVKRMAVYQPLDFGEELRSVSQSDSGDIDVT